jgi:hypothetical protein
MPDKKMYSKVMDLHTFCIFYLDISPGYGEEMLQMFIEYKSGKIKIKEDVVMKGEAVGGGFFATTKREFKRINKGNSEASIIFKTLGIGKMEVCNDGVVLHFFATDDEVRKPTKDGARGDENWVAGGKTKNLITGTTDEGVEEVVIKPLSAKDRIKGVDYVGHVDYN